MTAPRPIGERVTAVEVRVDAIDKKVDDLDDRLEARGDRTTQLRVAVIALLATIFSAVLGLIGALIVSGSPH